MQKIAESELILNKDGSIYHLNLLPEDIADTIIVVGDPDRVSEVSKYFDHIEIKKQKREFITHTGSIGSKRMTVTSTGISTDNIDIVLNELDALANIDFNERRIKPSLNVLNIVRIGTSGALQPSIPVDSFVISRNAIGLDGTASYYDITYQSDESHLRDAFIKHFDNHPAIQNAYAVNADNTLVNLFGQKHVTGTTVTACGFYGPQGRMLRAKIKLANFITALQQFNDNNHLITNFEMESSAIFALGKLLGHRCCSLNTIVANRCTGEFSKQPHEAVDKLIQYTLEKLSATVAATCNIA